MVSLLLLVIVLTVAMTMLFQMRAFAERQQFFMLPRQAARRATDYLSYYFASASDAGDVQNNPNALITYYNLNGAVLQASYDNLSGAEPGNAVTTPNVTTRFGDLGTDVITVVAPINPAKYRVFAPFPGVRRRPQGPLRQLPRGLRRAPGSRRRDEHDPVQGGDGLRRRQQRPSHVPGH